MPRTARLVVPDVAHHVVHRGNRRQCLFFSDADRLAYISLLASASQRDGVTCLAWCLMDNHIHIVLVPPDEGALRATIASAHTAYSQRINRQQGLTGHLFEGRFRSYPMDDAHLMIAVRYVENNPVAAGLVAHARDWHWSSARAHLGDARDPLTDVAALQRHVPNWAAMLQDGLEAGERNDAIEAALASGRPVAHADWLRLRGMTQHTPAKRGPRFATDRRLDASRL